MMIQNSRIDGLADKIAPDLIGLRRMIHRNPELAFEERATADLLAGKLRSLGLDPKTGVGRTGIMAEIEGTAEGPTIGVRADMDALPVIEATGLSYASQSPGKMHACGHDLHSTILIGVATILASLRSELRGRVRLIFQPAEETLEGAQAMIADGVLEPPLDAILGFHNWPALRAGAVGYHPKVVMASSDAFDVTLKGQAGHAAHPHTAIDAIVGAAAFIGHVQTIVSREVAPSIPAVITIGQIEGGSARNVIAEQAVLKGTVRALDAAAPVQIEAAMRRMLAGLGAAMRLQTAIEWRRLAPVLQNDAATLGVVLGAARAVLGPDNVVELATPSMGSEDFAWFAERVPAAHLRIGSKIDGLDTELHRANFNIDDRAITTGVRALTSAVLALSAAKP